LESCIPSLKCNIPEHGMKLTVNGKKPADLVITHARVVIEGEIWDTMGQVLGSSLVSFIRMAIHPVKLCPSYMNPTDFVKGSSSVTTVLHFGDTPDLRISHPTIMQNIEKLAATKNSKIKLRVEYGEESWGFQFKGILFFLEFTLTDLIKHVKTETPFPLPNVVIPSSSPSQMSNTPIEQKRKKVSIENSDVQQLVSMGFPLEQSRMALLSAEGNVNAAVSILLGK